MFDLTSSSDSIVFDNNFQLPATPIIHPSAFIFDTAKIEGNVIIGPNCWIGPHAIIRGLEGQVRLNAGCSVQDHCRVESKRGIPVLCSDRVRIGHGAHLFGCTLEAGVIVGLLAVCHAGSRIGANSMLGAMTVVSRNQHLEADTLYVGSPAKAIRAHDGHGLAIQERITDEYIGFARDYPSTLSALPGAHRVFQLDTRIPEVHPTAHVHASAVIVGNVVVGEHAVLGAGVVLRGDNGPVQVDAHARLETNAVVHASRNVPTRIGSNSHVSANAVLHGCLLGSHVHIGERAVILDKTIVEDHVRIEKNTFVKGGLVLAARTAWSGNPSRPLASDIDA